MAKIAIVHGPNLNLLGVREQTIYGDLSLKEIEELITRQISNEHTIETFQSNSEGAIIDKLYVLRTQVDGIVLNAGAYTHTSYAIRDAIAAIGIPVVEVHLSNIYSRESFRRRSVIAPVCLGQITGFGWLSYKLGIDALLEHLKKNTQS